MTYSTLKLVPSGGALRARATRAKCERHTCALYETKADVLAHARVDITRSGDFRYTVNAPKKTLLPLITASYIMLGELIEQLQDTD
ncbi:hypothetical protein A7J71_10090 [Achromobacter insolitus]|nr:hypothetical protein A7J71_10090 [Achromobacter insolitus]OCZ57906.1 hypothetical protein A7P22_12200 [Achromobacter insolitus]